jgi:hypothetical protein
MLTPDDQWPDGRKISYLAYPARWRHYDPVVFDLLKSLVATSDARLLERIEQSGLIPGAIFFDELISNGLGPRQLSLCRMWQKFKAVDLIFFDPDNGIEIKSRPKGRKGSSKYVYWDEIAQTAQAGHSLLIYQHFSRQKREQFVTERSERLLSRAGAAGVWAIRTSHVVFFLVSHPAHHNTLCELMGSMEKRLPDILIVRCF